jgi:hypothetical protein
MSIGCARLLNLFLNFFDYKFATVMDTYRSGLRGRVILAEFEIDQIKN